jgi:hypothetical protein
MRGGRKGFNSEASAQSGLELGGRLGLRLAFKNAHGLSQRPDERRAGLAAFHVAVDMPAEGGV